MVGNLFIKDKITYVFDNLSIKNSENYSYLKASFSEFKSYDHILIDSLHKNTDLKSIIDSVLIANDKVNEISISRFKGNKVDLIAEGSSNKTSIISTAMLNKYTQEWKTGYVFKKYDDESFILINKYKKNNADYLIAKLINLRDFKQRLYEDNIYTTYLLSKDNNEVLFSKNELSNTNKLAEMALFDHFKDKKNLLGGVKSLELNSINYLVAFDDFNEGVVVLTLLEESTVLGILNDLNTKSILFFMVAISFAGMLSVFASKKVSKTLEDLHVLANKITRGDYDFKLSKKSNDEIGDLGIAFETMGRKVSKLLSQLQGYNKKLETVVDQRTEELKKSLDLQSTMIDSVSEAFMIVDRNAIISTTHSRVTGEIFEKNPSMLRFGDLLGLDLKEHNEIAGLFEAMISGKAPFEELKQFLPDQVRINENKVVAIEYCPMINLKGKFTNIVVTASDITTEITSIEESEKQKQYVEMVLAVLKDKENYFDLVSEIKRLPEDFHSKQELSEFYRHIHTLKGNAGHFKITEVANILHNIEEKIESGDKDLSTVIDENLDNLKIKLKEVTLKQKEWLGVNPYYGGIDKSKEVSIETLEKFTLMLKAEDVSFDLYNVFLDHIVSIPLMKNFHKYHELLLNLSVVENIKLSKVEWNGFNFKVLPNRYDNIFNNFVHVYRNIMAHAFKGRNEQENTVISSAKVISKNNKKHLKIIVSDNGNGIDIEALKTCLISKDLYKKEMNNETILNMIFEDEISTSSVVNQISGRGVGLSSLKAALINIGGEITIHSEQDKGSEFVMSFPLAEDFVSIGENEWKKVA